MALTKCSTDTAVIADLGTTPQERGLTTDQFKAKFDEAATGLKTYLNDTLTTEVDTQLATKETPAGAQTKVDTHAAVKATSLLLGHVLSDDDSISIDVNGVISTTHNFKVRGVTRDISVTGDLAVTGVGFEPKAVLILAFVAGQAGKMSIGLDDMVNAVVLSDYNGLTAGSYGTFTGYSVGILQSSGNYATAKITATNSDGFTLTWNKTGTPTGTATIYCLALR